MPKGPLFLVVALLSFVRLGGADDDKLQYFRDLAETRNYTLGRPVSPKITPDGKRVVFLRSLPRDPSLRLFELDLATGQERELLTPARLLGGSEETLSAEEKARRERQRQSLKGFTAFQLSHDGSRLLVTLSGRLYVVERATLKVSALPGQGWIDPQFSPDSKFVAAVGPDREVHVIELATNVVSQVSQGATETLSHGTAEFVAQEEMSRNRGFWWSPDSENLLVQETDESQVEVRYVADPLHPSSPPTKFFYPRAGTPNATVRLQMIRRGGGAPRPVTWDSSHFPYLAHVVWPQHGPLTLLVQNRTQTEQLLIAVDPESGKSRTLIHETDPAWLNLDDNSASSSATHRPPFWLRDGKHFLWTTEQRGHWQVELRDSEGKLVREVTPTTFSYRSLLGIDEDTGTVWAAGGPDRREIQVWSFSLHRPGAGVAATSQRGIHGLSFHRESGLLLRSSDLFDGNWKLEVARAKDGQVVATIPSIAEPMPRLPTTALTQTSDGLAFDAAVTRPRNFVPGRKLPVILSVYAGPTSKMVSAAIRSYLPDQWMADHGFVVVRIDGRGTPARGRDWERVIKGNLIDIALQDQIAGLRSLARQVTEMDLTRVGVSGWSFGGYFSAMAAIRHPEIFRCAIVGAPVVTWENYDTHYTERYLGLPQDAPDAYRVSNVTTYAAAASRPMLFIHGITDDNVYFQHTLQLADALYLAGKHYELLPMLGTHMISDPVVRLRQQNRIMEFLQRELLSR